MDGEKAESILKKYNLEEKAEREFAKKTRGERGRINLVLRFRIYSEFLTKKQNIQKTNKKNKQKKLQYLH